MYKSILCWSIFYWSILYRCTYTGTLLEYPLLEQPVLAYRVLKCPVLNYPLLEYPDPVLALYSLHTPGYAGSDLSVAASTLHCLSQWKLDGVATLVADPPRSYFTTHTTFYNT